MSPGLFLVFFVYGLAFLAMGLAMALETGRGPALAETSVLLPLAVFGIIHGSHEWMEAFLQITESSGMSVPGWLPWLRLGLLVVSFVSLFLFAYQSLLLTSVKSISKRILRFSIFGVYVGVILISAAITYSATAIPWLNFLDGMARYLLAAPAAHLATLALRAHSRQVRQQGRLGLSKFLMMASFGFGIYSVTQLFVHPLAMFPAHWFNEESFLVFTGFPIQLIRAIVAIVIAYGMLRAAQIVEDERKNELFTAQQRLLGEQQARLRIMEQREVMRTELMRHIVEAQEDERARIARELHDETAQTLSAFSLQLATLRNTLPKRTKVTDTLDRLQDLGYQMSQGLYRLVHDLRPAHLDDLGLVPALKFLIEQDCCPKGLEVEFETMGSQQRLDSLIETVLFRVAQEALTNAARHSGSNQIKVRIRYAAESITIEVSDKGKGFDPSEEFRPPRGWGLAGMRERVEAVGGKLKVISASGRGTTIEAVIPLAGKS